MTIVYRCHEWETQQTCTFCHVAKEFVYRHPETRCSGERCKECTQTLELVVPAKE